MELSSHMENGPDHFLPIELRVKKYLGSFISVTATEVFKTFSSNKYSWKLDTSLH